MKRILFFSALFCLGISVGTFAQDRSAVMQQSTSTANMKQNHPNKPKVKKVNPYNQMDKPIDTTKPRDPKQPRLAPDSLRRGGATRVDTIR